MTVRDEVTDFLFREARYLDNREWRSWVGLFTQDALLWMPAWADEVNLTTDPQSELSLLYLNSRGEIEDRVFRIETGDSFASFPMDRTVRLTGNIMVDTESDGGAIVSCSWHVHAFGQRGQRTLGGTSKYELVRLDGDFRIKKKVMKLIDDRIDGPVDLYHIG